MKYDIKFLVDFMRKNMTISALIFSSSFLVFSIFSILYFHILNLENIHDLYIGVIKRKREGGGYDLSYFVILNLSIVFIFFIFQHLMFCCLRRVVSEIKKISNFVWVLHLVFFLVFLCSVSIYSYWAVSFAITEGKPIITGIAGTQLQNHIGSIDIWLPVDFTVSVPLASPLISIFSSWLSVFIVAFGFVAVFRPRRIGNVNSLSRVFRESKASKN